MPRIFDLVTGVLIALLTASAAAAEMTYLQTVGGAARPASAYETHDIASVLPPAGQDSIWFNGAPREALQDVEIRAFDLVFDPRDQSSLLGRYNGIATVRSLVIEAHTVTIRGRLHLPGVNLRLHAKSVVFQDIDPENPAQIDTSPLAIPANPNAHAVANSHGAVKRKAANGLPGQAAGDLFLLAGQVVAPGDSPRFVLRGSAGQPGGNGVNGAEPHNATYHRFLGAYPSPPTFRKVEPTPFNTLGILVINEIARAEHKKKVEAHHAKQRKYAKKTKHSTVLAYARPIPGGKPGIGGDAGQVGVSDPAYLDLVLREPGAGGAGPGKITGKAIDAAWNFLLKPSLRGPEKARTIAATPAAADGALPDPISMDLAGPTPWMTPALMRMGMTRFEDLFLVGDRDAAAALADRLWTWSDVEAASFDEAWGVFRTRLKARATAMQNGLDYFGNPPGWVPNLSFELNFAAYENEIDEAISSLYLADWIARDTDAARAKQRDLNRLVRTETARIASERRKVADIGRLIPEVLEKIDRISEETGVEMARIEAREAIISARFNREENAKAVLNIIFGALESAIFSDKPSMVVLGAAATGGRLALETKFSSETGEEGASALNALLQDDLIREAESDLEALDYRPDDEGGFAFYHGQIDAIAETLKARIRKELDANIAAAIGNSADPARAYGLFDRLQADPDYQEAFNSTVAFISKKRIYQDERDFLRSRLNASLAEIVEITWAVDRLRKTLLEDAPDEELAEALDLIRRRAEDRLTTYQYYLAKSFEFQVLEPAEVDYHNTALFRSLQELAAKRRAAGGDTADVLPHLKSAFTTSLRTMVHTILSGLNEDQFERRVPSTVRVNLNRDQIDALNTAGSVTIDLKKAGILTDRDRAARVTGLAIVDDRTRVTLGETPERGQSPVVEFSVVVDPFTFVQWGGKKIAFTHRAPLLTSIVPWRFVWQYPRGLLPNVAADAKDTAPIARLVGLDKLSQLNFAPSAHGTFTLIREAAPVAGKVYPVVVRRMAFDVTIEKSKAF